MQKDHERIGLETCKVGQPSLRSSNDTYCLWHYVQLAIESPDFSQEQERGGMW